MTIIEAINGIDTLKPNTYTQSDKIKWLSTLDGYIKLKIIDTHESDSETEFEGYTDDTPLDTQMLVESPYDEIYLAWLESKIDYANAEYTKYNNSVTHYNDILDDYNNYYNRTHMPKGTKIRYY